MAIIEGLGSIAGNFAQGYQQARTQKNQESLQQQQAQYEHAGRLFQMADQVQDPVMKDTLFSSATRIMDSLDKPEKKNPKGLGAMIGGPFGVGHHTPDVKAPASTPMGPSAAMGSAPSAVGANSQTFGSPGLNIDGPELSVGSKSALPPVPQVGDMPSGPDVAKASLWHAPTLDQRGPLTMTPPSVGTVPSNLAAQAAPAGATHPESGKPLNIPSPVEITQYAMKSTQSPQFGFRDPYHQGLAEKQAASQVMDTLLKVTDQHLAQNPNIRTLADADNDPNFGPEFRQVMDAIGRYEAAGQIEKGTLENWQKQRFADVRFGSDKYNPFATVDTGTGQRFQVNPVTQRFDIPVGGPTAVKPPDYDERVKLVFAKNPADWTTDDKNLVDGEALRLSRLDRSKMSQEESLKDQFIAELRAGVKNGPVQKMMSSYMATAHPLNPIQSTLPTVNPQTGETVISVFNHNTGQITQTKLKTPGPTFIPERYMTKEINGPAVDTGFKRLDGTPRMEPGPKIKAFDAAMLMAGHTNGDMSLDTLVNLLKENAVMSPDDKQRLTDYVNRQLKPTF